MSLNATTGGIDFALERLGPCTPTPTSLCFHDRRFRVEARWQDFDFRRGSSFAEPLTAESSTFWFFDPANVELVVKVLDALHRPLQPLLGLRRRVD